MFCKTQSVPRVQYRSLPLCTHLLALPCPIRARFLLLFVHLIPPISFLFFYYISFPFSSQLSEESASLPTNVLRSVPVFSFRRPRFGDDFNLLLPAFSIPHMQEDVVRGVERSKTGYSVLHMQVCQAVILFLQKKEDGRVSSSGEATRSRVACY